MIIMNGMTSSSKKINAKIILFLFELNVILGIFSRSAFEFATSRWLQITIFFVITVMFLISLDNFKCTVFDIIWLFCGTILCILTNGIVGNLLLYMVIIAFSMRNSNISELIDWTIISVSITLLIILLAVRLGIIPNLSFVRNGIYRVSLGMRFPLIFGAYIFYLSALLAMKFGKEFPIRMSIILVGIAILLNRFTNAKNDSICILLLIIVILAQKLPELMIKKICKISTTILLILSFIIPFLTYIFPYGSKMYIVLDKLTTGRLYYQNILCNYFQPKLLGQNIIQTGLGGSNGIVNNYFYIDSSFTRILFMGGILFFILFVYAWMRCVYKFVNNGYYLIGMVIMVVWINGFFEDSLSNPTTSILIAFLLINTNLVDLRKKLKL